MNKRQSHYISNIARTFSLVFILHLINSTCFAQVSSKNTEDVVNKFLNNFEGKSVSHRILLWDTLEFKESYGFTPDPICGYFSHGDCDNFLLQLQKQKKSKWDRKKLTNAGLVIAKKSETGKVWVFSKALFSSDRQTVIIQAAYYCGDVCGERCTYIFRKNKDKWIIEKKVNCWTS